MRGRTLQGCTAEVVRGDAELKGFGDGSAEIVVLERNRKGGGAIGRNAEGVNRTLLPFKEKGPGKLFGNAQLVREGARVARGTVGFKEDALTAIIGASLNLE